MQSLRSARLNTAAISKSDVWTFVKATTVHAFIHWNKDFTFTYLSFEYFGCVAISVLWPPCNDARGKIRLERRQIKRTRNNKKNNA